MLRGVLICSVVLIACLSSAAGAAVLRSSGDNVRVDIGTGFGPQQIPPTTTVRPGHLIIVGDGSGAVITFDTGCSIEIKAGYQLKVPAQSPFCMKPDTAAKTAKTDGSAIWLLGGVAAVGGIAALIGSQQGSGGKPASP